MSKSYKNFIGLDETANSMFVKIMEIKDELIIKYFVHCTTLSFDEIKPYEARLATDENPRNIKLDLAHEVIKLYHCEEAAIEAKAYFEKVLSE
jgi:tyrosyl-tRNA synthetase